MTEKEIFVTLWMMIFQWEFIASITSSHTVRMAIWIVAGFIYGYLNGWLRFQHA